MNTLLYGSRYKTHQIATNRCIRVFGIFGIFGMFGIFGYIWVYLGFEELAH